MRVDSYLAYSGTGICLHQCASIYNIYIETGESQYKLLQLDYIKVSCDN